MATTFEKLRERSIIDNVSSAYTREYFIRHLREQIAQDTKSTLSLGFINLRIIINKDKPEFCLIRGNTELCIIKG